jgi:hypothetical protein
MTWVRGPPSTFKLPISEETHDLAPRDSVRRVVHHSKIRPLMSALGQKRTLGHVRVMSALPPKADIPKRRRMSALCMVESKDITTFCEVAVPSCPSSTNRVARRL